ENLKVTYKQDFQGEYFENFPITLRAIPRLGYSFSHWEGTNSTSPFLEIDLEGKRNLGYHAVFVPVASPYKDSIVFNEVSCYNHNSSDWLEIHNMGEQKVDLTNWIIKNQKEEYVLPPSSIAANSYIVIAKDTTRFLNVYPQIRDRVIGDFDFGLNKQTDRLELYTPEGATVDTFTYNIATPGRDFTIDLKSPKLDNGDSNNWEVSIGLGTPGYHNTTYWAALTYEQQMLWMQRGLALGLFLLIGMIVYLWKWR
ncbi:MAG: lamin tail domain-containing protein, partial [Saprospiraceae bacterium]